MRNSSSTYTISIFSSSSLFFFFIFSNEMKENKEKEENTIEKMGKSQSKPLPPKVGQGWDPRAQCVHLQSFPVQTSDAAFPPLHCMPHSLVMCDDHLRRLHRHGCIADASISSSLDKVLASIDTDYHAHHSNHQCHQAPQTTTCITIAHSSPSPRSTEAFPESKYTKVSLPSVAITSGGLSDCAAAGSSTRTRTMPRAHALACSTTTSCFARHTPPSYSLPSSLV